MTAPRPKLHTRDIFDELRKIQKNLRNLQRLLRQAVPIGTITMFGDQNAPDGYFLCDGTAISRTTYADLFAVISVNFGNGDGSTTFNVPDFSNGKIPRGVTTTGTGPASQFAAVGANYAAVGVAFMIKF